jgi:hypothetical protein
VRRFLVQAVGAHVADVRVGEADDLPGIAGVGKDLLVAGEGGIKNDFAAAARARAGRATLKDAPVFERQYGLCRRVVQSLLLCLSYAALHCALSFASAVAAGITPKRSTGQ